MSLSLALANAVSGLRAGAARTEVISNNISNAMTEGYGRRDISVSSHHVGATSAGVRVDGITRASSPVIAEKWRIALGGQGFASAQSGGLSRLAQAVGEPGAPGALATAADAFDDALAAAADTPESEILLAKAVSSASDYAAAIGRIAAEAMALRSELDASIAGDVAKVNSALSNVHSLNGEIKARAVMGEDITALEDQRDRLISEISSIIPVKVSRRANEQVAIFARNGAQLLDGKVFELEFTPTGVVTPEKTLANGALSGLTVNGWPFPVGEAAGDGFLDGGSLSAKFSLRDDVIPGLTGQLNGLAAGLIGRTEGLADDPTLAPGEPGLFVDGGVAGDPAEGLALRLQVNDAVNPAAGGEVWRLRDGLNASARGDVGEDDLLRGLQDAMRRTLPAAGLSGSKSAAGFAASFSATVHAAASEAEADLSYRRGAADELSDSLISQTGVDSDQELTKLLAAEQAFAANARVIQVVDDLLETLTRL